jgi:type I restriction enzyme S subunit
MRIKEICDFVSRGTTPEYVDDSPFKVMNQATFSKGWLDESNIRFTSKPAYDARITKGDLLMASTGGGVLGKVFYFDKDDTCFYADSHVSILRNSKGKHLMKFLYYYFLIRYEEINATMVKGSTNQTELQRNYLLAYEINMPTLSVQQKIVDYLNEKTSAIDAQVELLEKKKDAYTRLKKAMINRAVTHGLDENVKLKDSGVEWIGMIPEHWERFRLKDLGYMYSGLTGKSGDDFRCDDETKTKPYVPFTNVLNNTVVDNGNFHYVVLEENEQQNQVKAGDLLFLMSSEDYESIAKSAVVLGNPGEAYLNSFCRGLRITNHNCYAPFLNYQLNSEMYRDALRFEARGFTRINIKIDRVASHFVSLPPFSEQQAIADYLDEKCVKIDAAIANIDKQTDALKRLKRSLINEVITGQRAV